MKSKPEIIETIINTAALALTAFGTNEVIRQKYYGFVCIIFGMILEFAKYYGRKRKYW